MFGGVVGRLAYVYIQMVMVCDYFLHYSADINECTTGSSGCGQNCTNTPGSYLCSCDHGYQLFQNGTNDVYVEDGESGLQAGDVYRINHTCVREYRSIACYSNDSIGVY